MLARAPSPYLSISLNSKPLELSSKATFFIPEFSSCVHPSTKSTKLRRTRKARSGFCVKAGYTRTPLDAPGAYQLIDEESGQKVIVWGGADDPPPDLGDINKFNLKNDSGRRARTRTSSGKGARDDEDGVERAQTVSKKDSATANIRKVSGGFGRLKTQKIKALVNRAYQVKQEVDEPNYEPDLEITRNKPGSSDSKLGYTRKMKKVTNFDRTEEEMDHSDEDVNYDIEHEIDPDLSQRYETNQAGLKASNGSASNLRGWGGGRSKQRSEYEPKDTTKQRKKFSVDSGFFSRKSFKDLGCSESVMKALEAQLYTRASHIQALSYSSVLEGKSCIIADQSGSGKTLAYLAPLIHRLRQEEIQGVSKSSSQSPRAVILVPTAELASQVLSNCRSMSKNGVPFRSMVVTGGFRQKTQLENLEEGVDVLIATPGRFMYLIKEGFLRLTNLRCAVLDEVDILFNDEDFEVAQQNLINSSPVTTQHLFVTATLPVDIYNKLVEVFPDCKVIMGPGMHRTSPGLEEVLVDCSGNEEAEKTPEAAFSNKKTALLQLVEKIPVSKTIIFCNKIETCRKVENVLRRNDRKERRTRVLPFHAALDQKSRLASMKEFRNSHTESDVSLFLVCTDRASRGIDFSGVDHVVLFDFPRDPSEYVRRVGRTARGAGGTGKAFIFVVGKQVSLAQRIIDRNQKGHPLHDVPAAYELF